LGLWGEHAHASDATQPGEMLLGGSLIALALLQVRQQRELDRL
jgi:hypothetical protein